jgi:hypothetical protein
MALNTLLTTLALAQLATSAPMPVENYATARMTEQALFNLTATTDQQVLAAWSCRDQSCIAADFAGSSGNTPRFKPQGGGATDTACVRKYNPNAPAMLMNGPTQSTGMSTTLMYGINVLWNTMLAITGSTDKVCQCL